MQKKPRDKSNRFSPYVTGNPYMVQPTRYAPGTDLQAAQVQAAQAAAAASYYGLYMQPGALQQLQQLPGGGMMGMQQQQQEKVQEIKVSQTSTPKSVAGKIAADARNNALAPVVARGKTSVNIAAKAIAIACSFLAEGGISLSVSPYHKNDGDQATGRSVVFFLKKKTFSAESLPPTTVLKVTKVSASSKVAGSIAAKIRQGEVIAMQGIGPDAVMNAVDAFVVARRFLKADSALDVQFTPQFITVPLGEKTASALYFKIEAYTRT